MRRSSGRTKLPRMIRRTLLAACAFLPFAAAAAEPGADAMLAHRAAYRLALDSVREIGRAHV